MKIGVFTLPLENNYGGNLQNFALQQVLKEMGHEVVTIDWHRKKEYGSFARQFIGYIHRLYSHYIKKEKILILSRYINYNFYCFAVLLTLGIAAFEYLSVLAVRQAFPLAYIHFRFFRYP